MLSLVIFILPLALPLCLGTPVLEAQRSTDRRDADNTNMLANLEWETVTLPNANPVNSSQYLVACGARLGINLDGRSCFNALGHAPSGMLQESWVNQGHKPPGIRSAVSLPIVIFSGKLYSEHLALLGSTLT